MTQVEILDAGRDRAGGYKVDASRGQRVGRVGRSLKLGGYRRLLLHPHGRRSPRRT